MQQQRLEVAAEWKFAGDAASGMTFSGYGAVFGNVDSYGDVIKAGAFADTLREAKGSGQWPAMLLQHGGGGFGSAEDMTPVGIWTQMEEDTTGLKLEGKLADIPRGRDLYTLMKMEPRPAVSGLSIGYIVKAFEPRTSPEQPRRTLTKLHLMEVSPVTFPANPKARVTDVKSAAPSEIERLLRDAGFNREERAAFMARGFNGLKSLRDAATGAGNDEVAALIRRNINLLK